MIRSLITVFAAISCVFCSCVSTQSTPPSEIFYTKVAMEVRSKGRLNMLVAQAHPATDHVASISPGTALRLAGSQQIDTLTHGSQSWKEAVFLDGPMCGKTVALGFRDVAKFLR